MTPVQLIEDIEKELKKVLEHIRLPSPLGEDTVINIFQYGLPIEKTQEDAKRKFPYVLILPKEGDTGEITEPQKVNIQLLIGIFENGLENQGKKWVLNIINDITERFLKEPILNGRYYADEKMNWVIDTEEEYPYHYGAMWITFNTATFRRESEHA